jgi:hypothetical protein
MSAATCETDYLIVGAGAVGLAFADVLLTETDAHITIIDRHGKPGGHWNDAYSFVALHQPSAFYGVNSLPLGTNRKDTTGCNAGLYELATGPDVSGYFDAVMRQRLLPSGRIVYHPLSDYRDHGRIVSLLTGRETQVNIRRKLVDATFTSPQVPSVHTPKFKLADGIRVVPPNALVELWKHDGPPPSEFIILGAGKTAMDAVTWLLGAGVDANRIQWVVPRDSWLLNRKTTQPGIEFFDAVFGGQADQLQAFAEATSVDNLFERLEASSIMLRLDRAVRPTMFHFATISEGEVEVLRTVQKVIRKGRVTVIDASGLTLERGTHAVSPGALYVDCTASAVERRPTRAIFEGRRITPQMVRVPQPAFSAALCAYVEAHYDSDEVKNRLCRPVPFPHSLAEYLSTNIVNMANQGAWSQDKPLMRWIRDSRLDGFAKVLAVVDPADASKQAVLTRLRANVQPAMENLQRLNTREAR